MNILTGVIIFLILILIGFWLIFNIPNTAVPNIIISNNTSINSIKNQTTTALQNTNVSTGILTNDTFTGNWVAMFIQQVNRYRASQSEDPLVYNSILDNFAHIRFNTTSKNYNISHYNFSPDYSCFYIKCVPISTASSYYYNKTALYSVLGYGAQISMPLSGSYWQTEFNCTKCYNTVYFTNRNAINNYFYSTYGRYINLTFTQNGSFNISFPQAGEEILYPEGYNTTAFIRLLQQKAPGHWSELMTAKFKYYGYYIQRGPVYLTLDSCPVTEIGANVNIPALYAIHNCTYTLRYEDWLVLELLN